MKFIADSMLGRLCRWLRMSGYDVLYSEEIEDDEILELAKAEGRIILTSDKALYQRALKKGLIASLLKNDDLIQDLKQMEREHNITIKDSPVMSKCPLCNSDVKKVEKGEVRGQVPEGVFNSADEFWMCRDCKKVYWEGGHWINIKEVVKKLRQREE